MKELLTKQLAGEDVEYVGMDLDGMTVLVPLAELESVGVRQPIDADDARALLELLGDEALKDPGHSGRRRRNSSRLTSGDPEEVAKIVRSLNALRDDTGKPLRSADSRHMKSAMEKLVGELAIALDVDAEEAEELMREALARGLEDGADDDEGEDAALEGADS